MASAGMKDDGAFRFLLSAKPNRFPEVIPGHGLFGETKKLAVFVDTASSC